MFMTGILFCLRKEGKEKVSSKQIKRLVLSTIFIQPTNFRISEIKPVRNPITAPPTLAEKRG